MSGADAHRKNLLTIFSAALQAVNGRLRVREYLESHPIEGPVAVVAVGKAATAMALGVQDVLGERILDAFVVTKHGYEEALPWPVHTAGHPLPDQQSIAAGEALREFVKRLHSDATVLVLLSGGASTLLEVLPPEVTLEQCRQVNEWLLASGLDIVACNQVRKRLSRIKGGRLAQWLTPHPVLGLVISDVRGDNLRSIASGLLVPYESEGPSSSLDRILKASGAPDLLLQALAHEPPAPSANDDCFKKVRLKIIATLADALRAAGVAANQLGYRPRIDQRPIAGDALAAGARLGRVLSHTHPNTLRIWGGETTLTLPPDPGRGGRNQSLALAAALSIKGMVKGLFLAAGTDGSDGPGEDAGALVDGDSVSRMAEQGVDPENALKKADAGRALAASGDLVQTGPTGTNVMDIMFGLRY